MAQPSLAHSCSAGSSIWIDDDALINKIGEFSVACVVVNKQGRKRMRLQAGALDEPQSEDAWYARPSVWGPHWTGSKAER
jgi:hypothetical protein